MSRTTSRHHVVVVGAGFGGLAAARRLGRANAATDVTVIDRHNYHTFQPLLYQVATAGLEPQNIGQSVRSLLRRQGARFRLGAVVDVDLDGRSVRLEGGEVVPYDTLVLAVGASTADYGIPGVAEHAFPLKSLPDAMRLRNHLLRQFEHADSGAATSDPAALTVVVVGGGPTGVELSGSLSELMRRVMPLDHPDLDLDRARIVLVEMLDALLPAYAPRGREYTRRALEAKGVEVRLGTAIEEVTSEGVVLSDGSEVATSTVVWTAGVRANPLADLLDVEQTKGGRIPVGADLSVPGHPEVFVVGDLAAATGREGEPLPQLAPVALQQGRYVADRIAGRLRGERRGPFRYRDKGTMTTIGRRDAVAELPARIRLWGMPARIAWLGLHIVQLVGFRNRVSVLVNWSYNYLTYDRAARLVLDQHEPDEAEVVARHRSGVA